MVCGGPGVPLPRSVHAWSSPWPETRDEAGMKAFSALFYNTLHFFTRDEGEPMIEAQYPKTEGRGEKSAPLPLGVT